VRINKDDLDEYALAKLLACFADESVIEKLRAVGEAEDDTLAGLRDELEQVRSRHSELAQSVRAGKTSMMLAEQIEPGLLKDMATLGRQIAEREVPGVLGCLIEPGKEVRERWAEAPISAKRTAARALLCPEWFGELRVHRSARRGRTRVPTEQRMRFFRRMRSAPPPAPVAA
jgi:hypothetical protein